MLWCLEATRLKPPMMVLHQLCGSARVCFLPGWVAKPLSYIVTQLMASLKSPFGWRLHWKSSQSSGETLQAPLIATQSVTSPGLIACVRSRKVRTLTGSLGSDREDVHSQSSSFFHPWFNVVADECTSCFITLCLFMKRLDKWENGRLFLEARRRGRTTVAPAVSTLIIRDSDACDRANWSTDSLNCDRLVSELYLTLWTSLHIAMTSVIVFKRGCIFMCNSFCRNHVCQWWNQRLVRSFYNT